MFKKREMNLTKSKQLEKKKATDNEFYDIDYQMKKEYSADNLVIAKLTYVSNEIMEAGPINKTTNLKYLFEVFDEEEKTRYREIFSGFKADTEAKNFTLPYLVEIEKFTDWFPELKGTKIPNLAFILILNDINFEKEKSFEKTK